MAYLGDLKKKISENTELFPRAEVQFLGREKCVIAGHKGLYSLSDEEVIVRRCGYKVIVRGKRLQAESVDETEIVLSGEIVSAEFLTE